MCDCGTRMDEKEVELVRASRRKKAHDFFKNEAVFSPDYLPPRLLYRDKELTQLATFFRHFPRNAGKQNVLLVWGENGTGKTVTVKKFLYVLEYVARLEKLSFKVIYISIFRPNTSLHALVRHFLAQSNPFLPSRGYSLDELLEFVRRELQNLKVLIVLDSIEFLAERVLDNFLTFLKSVTESAISVILISTQRHTLPVIDGEIFFRPYSPDEMISIIMQRCAAALTLDIKLDIIKRIVTFVVEHYFSNLSLALQLVYKLFKQAELTHARQVTLSHVESFLKELRATPFFSIQSEKKISETERQLLVIIQQLLAQKQKQRQNLSQSCPIVTLKEVYQEYVSRSSSTVSRHEHLKYTRIWQLMKSLEKKGVIMTHVISPHKNRGGRTTCIHLL